MTISVRRRGREGGGPPTTGVCFATGHRVVVPGAVALEDGMHGVGCLDGRWGWKRKGVVRQALQTRCSGGNGRKASAHFPFEKRGFAAAPVNKERRCSFCTQTLQDVPERSHAWTRDYSTAERANQQ